MLPQQIDVDVPGMLRAGLGTLLADLEIFVRARGLRARREYKPPGGHVTPWWLYVTLAEDAPSRSEVQFGETDHAEVNPVPHLWVRAKEAYRPTAKRLLLEFMGERQLYGPPRPPMPSRPPPVPPLVCLREFEGFKSWGDGYLTLAAGDVVELQAAPTGSDAAGWAYGCVVPASGDATAAGWFPPTFVR